MTNLVRNSRAAIFFNLLTLCLLTQGQVAFASKAKVRSQAATQQFKAVEAGETIGIDNEDATAPATKAESQPSAPARAAAPAPVVPTSALLPKDRGTFERVPDESKDSIAKRLKIIETLILEYGRAYDYRIHTTKELNAILDDLKKQTPSNNAPQSS